MKRPAKAVAAIAAAALLTGCGAASGAPAAAPDRNLADCMTMSLGEVTMTAAAYKQIVDVEWAALVAGGKDGKAEGGYRNVDEFLAAKYPDASTRFAAPAAWCAQLEQ